MRTRKYRRISSRKSRHGRRVRRSSRRSQKGG